MREFIKSTLRFSWASANAVLASTGDRFSYSYFIPGGAAHHKASFEYENHSQQRKFHMHCLAWVGFSNSGTSRAKTGEYDTVTFTGYGIWSKGGVDSLQQTAVQPRSRRKSPTWVFKSAEVSCPT